MDIVRKQEKSTQRERLKGQVDLLKEHNKGQRLFDAYAFCTWSSTYIWSGHCTKDGRFRAMNFNKFIKSYENSEEIALYYSKFDIVIYHSVNIYSSESAIFGTVATPDVCRTPWLVSC